MAEGSDLEKTEQASAKRLENARQEGDVPRSRELATCAVLFSAGLGMLILSEPLSLALKNSMRTGLRFDRSLAFDPSLLLVSIAENLHTLLLAFAPLALLLFLVAIASPVLIGGWVFTGKAFIPQFSRLNPIKGLGNMMSKNAAVELLKSIIKTILVASVAYLIMAHDVDAILKLANLPLKMAIPQVNNLLLMGFIAIVSALVFIAAIDVPYQLYQYDHKLKMTKQELRQEAKESEGSPEIKARIRQQQREMAKRRMMSAIPKADVVITNPTHYAVAIQYKGVGMRAPVVVAKGADVLALKIRELATEHKITILEAPKLARALFAHTELGTEIPQALYSAVAEVLAYVFQMRTFNQDGGARPQAPSALDVPEQLDPHSLLSTLTNEPLGLSVS
jgi:flagellar biosynthetic protein FlhB